MKLVNLQVLVEELVNQELVVGLFLAVAGLVFMLLGTRVYRGLTALTYGVIGFVLGAGLPLPPVLQLACGFLGALGLAILCTFVVKPCVMLLAGGWATFGALLILDRFGVSLQVTLFGAVAAFAIAISLSIIMHHETVAFVTSLQGALLCIGGLINLVSQTPSVWIHLKSLLLSNPVFGPFLIVAGTITGLCLQLSDLRHKDTGVGV